MEKKFQVTGFVMIPVSVEVEAETPMEAEAIAANLVEHQALLLSSDIWSRPPCFDPESIMELVPTDDVDEDEPPSDHAEVEVSV